MTVLVHSLSDVEAVVVAATSGRLVGVVVVADDARAADPLKPVTGEFRRTCRVRRW